MYRICTNIGGHKHEPTPVYSEKRNQGFIPSFPVAAGKLARPGGPLHRYLVMLPIPGTSSVAHLEENVAAANVKLDTDEWKVIENDAQGG